jgi:hypothetical protein
MARTGRPGLSAEQKRELRIRWKDGQSLSDIGRAQSLVCCKPKVALCRRCGSDRPVL